MFLYSLRKSAKTCGSSDLECFVTVNVPFPAIDKQATESGQKWRWNKIDRNSSQQQR